MKTTMSWRAAGAALVALALAAPSFAQAPAQTRAEGLLNDYTADLDGSGPWHVSGDWSLALNTASGRVEFLAALHMVRSDNQATRQAHTHHVRMVDGQVTPLANGYRITGTAAFTSNGALAGFSGSPIEVELTGGSALAFATLKVRVLGGAATHFGTETLGGVVKLPR